jgi:gamma-glutamyltranspeptidase/glutathione hydrolase
VLNEGPRPDEPALPDPGGTIHISAVDRDGNLAALTQTHGVGYGSGVVVPGTGFVMSGGMFLFDPGPGSANSIGPRKRPLHNMCPTIVLKDGRPFATIGATGGRKIPATLHQILMHMLLRGKDIDDAFASSRVHFESRGPVFTFAVDEPAQDYLQKLGFEVRQGSANPHGIQLDLPHGLLLPASMRVS